MTHTVQAKETLFSIAKKYSTNVDQLIKINGLKSNNLFIGQVIKIDLPTPVTTTPKPVPTHNTVFTLRNVFLVKKENKGTYNNYVLTYPTPTGNVNTGMMRDNYPSPNIANPKGVSYSGLSLFQTNIPLFSDLCQQTFYIDLLHYIAKNEGCFDAVNSYDRAIFSFGFIQFTGGLASGSMLTRVLQRFKTKDEYAFNDCFGKYGMNVQNYKVPLFQVETTTGIKEGDAAYLEIANNLPLTTAFIASGFRRSMIRSQVEIALEEYVLKALSPTQMIVINGVNIALNQILKTQGGFALRVDLCVNRGLGGSLIVLKKAIEQVVAESGIKDLSKINEKRVVEMVAQNDIEAWKKQRVLKILNSGFSFLK
ncbi:LysM peptidoglycan-binding domain-containing protein [Arcicella sp. LKC2W]|uniref:LysM peptidoglycan-binding domain-containing protein n=1 Tax=Arcicella sp. LKC2W TaxID=2984198 RepID=UPI002B1EC7FA|nr:LysM peptidoglycan-binding domain-containing protein [Arcicella sp. LKC2W]MEA5458456.1 LysM peptidoglycan-binding domain-containing protein [Arcicella sp. LKC2W]